MEVKRRKHATAMENIFASSGLANLSQVKVLVVGAGGLGCEILKNLATTGFKKIHVIDTDVIESTNLNRQFLFRSGDVGKPKAEVAARRLMENSAVKQDLEITPHVKRIEEMPDVFYENFHIIVCGLDSVSARRWINAKIVDLCLSNPAPEALRPLIDGGSEGFRGQARVILPGITACYECTLDLLLTGDSETYPLCTIASIPRLPEHCIEWARIVAWPHEFGDTRQPNLDDEHTEDAGWLLFRAQERAKEFGIEGVDIKLLLGVLKRIIPSIASTNAIIAASSSIEALKLATGKFDPMNNYFMYTGDSGVYSSVFEFQKRDDCGVCGAARLKPFEVTDRSMTLEMLLTRVATELKWSPSVLPSVTTASGTTLFMSSPPSLREKLEKNLKIPVDQLIAENTELAVTHPDLPYAHRMSINFCSA